MLGCSDCAGAGPVRQRGPGHSAIANTAATFADTVAVIMFAHLATNREELGSALAAAEADREQLEAALVGAEAALVNSVTDASKADANRADANAKVDQARARCRQLRTALIRPGHSEFPTQSRKRMDTPVKRSEEPSERAAGGSLPSIQLGEQAVPATGNRSQHEPRQRKSSQRSDVSASVQEPGRKDARARPDLPRQAIGFLALTLTYLAYFHVDVQLQIVNLPSVFP